MKRLIEGLALFAAGVGVGIFLMQPGVAQEKSAQEKPAPTLRLNHVGIYAKDYERSMEFFTKTVGLREAFTIKSNDGKPTLTYLQINRDTFLELAPATGDRQPGLSHVGIWPENLSATVAALRARREGGRSAHGRDADQHYQRHRSRRGTAGAPGFSARVIAEEGDGRVEVASPIFWPRAACPGRRKVFG